MKIWLDDERPAPDGWTWFKSAAEVWMRLAAARPRVEAISLDHDLGDIWINPDTQEKFEVTGYTLLCEIEVFAERGMWDSVPEEIIIHSANPVGRKNMEAAIDSINRLRNNDRDN